MGDRKSTEALILKYVDKIAPGGENKKLYEELFKGMNNKQFDAFMTNLKNKTSTLCVIAPLDSPISKKITVKNNIKVGKELGYDFFQHVIVKGDGDKPPYKSPNKYLVYKLPFRRAAQTLSKKISIPKDSKSIDLATGQVTGSSQASKLTYPEIQMLTGMGLDKSLKELLKNRGGDIKSQNAMMNLLYKYGKVDDATLKQYEDKVISAKTLINYWRASHIKTTL